VSGATGKTASGSYGKEKASEIVRSAQCSEHHAEPVNRVKRTGGAQPMGSLSRKNRYIRRVALSLQERHVHNTGGI
jgi:hypothetical protein